MSSLPGGLGRRPRVWLKAAATLDGRITDHRGASKWITSEEARAEGRRLRSSLDAILVGSGTLLADDPALTARIPGGRDPLPVVLDTHLRCPEGARIFAGSRRPLLYCGRSAPARALPAEVVRVGPGPGGLDLTEVLADLSQRGVRDLLVEGGGRVHRSLIDAGLADRLILFLSPRVLAGGEGFVAGPPVDLGASRPWRILSSRQVGPDLMLELDLTQTQEV